MKRKTAPLIGLALGLAPVLLLALDLPILAAMAEVVLNTLCWRISQR